MGKHGKLYPYYSLIGMLNIVLNVFLYQYGGSTLRTLVIACFGDSGQRMHARSLEDKCYLP
jgi:hypothetical protein